jgi:sialate O-acetylesterase
LEKWTATVDPASAKKHYPSDPDLDTADWTDIAVPKPCQDAGLKGFDGLVWFRRSIELPETWKGKDLRLSLSVVKDADVVWFNGTLVGVTQTAGAPRNYLIEAKLVKPGKNLLVAAIANKTGPGGFCSAPGQMLIQPIDLKEKPIPLAGTWKAKAAIKAGDLIPMPRPLVGNYKTITALDNGMIAPLTPFGIKGALWYQGESNWPFGPQYRRLLPTLIADWRGRFGVGDFPFLIVSLANYNSEQTKPVEPGWAELREAQWRTVRKVPNTGLAVTVDIGDANDIHPRNKQEVGRRLGLVARQVAYGEKDLVASGPEFDEMMIEKTAIRLYFKHIGGGLTVRGNQTKATRSIRNRGSPHCGWLDSRMDHASLPVRPSNGIYFVT